MSHTCVERKVSILTGMRYAKIQRLHDYPEWYSGNRNQIRLNEEAQKIVKRKAKERTIDLLPSTLPYIIDQFYNGPAPPDVDTWDQDCSFFILLCMLQNPVSYKLQSSRRDGLINLCILSRRSCLSGLE